MPTVSTIAVRVSNAASILRGGICVYMKTTALKKINEWLNFYFKILIILKENGAIAIVDSMFYNSARWRKKRKKILKRDKYMCQIGIRYGKRVEATVVHHIYPRDEYPEYQWCDWNLISVSAESHNKLHDRVTNHLTQIGENLKRRTPPT